MHDEYGKEALWLFDTGVGHFHEDVGIFVEIDHEFLLFLHLSETILINYMCVMEKEIIFRCQLNFNLFYLILTLSTLFKANMHKYTSNLAITIWAYLQELIP